jgi:hypothetical protein
MDYRTEIERALDEMTLRKSSIFAVYPGRW